MLKEKINKSQYCGGKRECTAHHHKRITVFQEEIRLLKRGTPLTSQSKLFQIYPFLDQDGHLKVGGRLQNASLPSINEIRSNGFWIPGINRVVMIYVHQCVTCQKLRIRIRMDWRKVKIRLRDKKMVKDKPSIIERPVQKLIQLLETV